MGLLLVLLKCCRTVDALVLPMILVNSPSTFLAQFRARRNWSQGWEELVSVCLLTFRSMVGKGLAFFWLEREGVLRRVLAVSSRSSCISALRYLLSPMMRGRGAPV